MSGIGTSGILTSTLSCTTYYETVEGNAFSWGAEVKLKTTGGTYEFPTYYVSNREIDGNYVRWTCSDATYKLDKEVEFTNSDFTEDKISAYTVLNKASSACGFAQAAFSGGALEIFNCIGDLDRSLVEGKTAREIYEMFATAMCGCWVFCPDNDGGADSFVFSPFGSAYRYTMLSVHTKIPTGAIKNYTCVIMQDGDKIYTSGAGSARNTLVISTPLASQELCGRVCSAISGFTYEAWECRGLTSWLIYPGDVGTYMDGKTRRCTNITMYPSAAGIFFSASANAVGENECEYTSQVQRQLRHKTEWEQRNGNTALSKKDGLKIFKDENSGKSTVISVYK